MASQLTRLGMVTAHAQSAADYKALVCVFLFGGNDANNMIVPIDSRYAAYQTMRGRSRSPQARLLPAGSERLRLPPRAGQRAAALQPVSGRRRSSTSARWSGRRRATRSNNSSLPRNLYSHSDQTQQWQSSDPNGGGTGWGGRINDVIARA